MRKKNALVLALIMLGGLSASHIPASAQTPPSAKEIAAYTGLHAAAHRGDARRIIRLLAGGANANAVDGNGRTPLHVAAFAGKHAAMRALAKGGSNPRALDKQLYDTVTIAAVADDLRTMQVALEIGGSPREITSIYGGTALIAAAHLGHYLIIDQLIRAGAPRDHVNNLGWTALLEAVILGDGGQRHTISVEMLVATGARHDLADKDGVTPLEHARRRGYTTMVNILEAMANSAPHTGKLEPRIKRFKLPDPAPAN